MKKIISALLILVFISGCSSNNVDEEPGNITVISRDKSNYNYVMPFETSYGRFEHTGKDYIEIGRGLTEISKEYFETSKYDLKEGQITTDYRNEFYPLVKRREGKENPFGLNPVNTLSVKVNSEKEVTGPLFVSDLYEINFVDKKNHDKLAGVSLALVLNKTIQDDDGYPTVVDDSVLYDFATQTAGPKLESYLRKKPELNNVPIVIAIYVTDTSNASIPGNYIAKAKYENRQGQFVAINQEWAIFPTESGRKVDGNINSQIANMKKSVNLFIPDDVGIIGYGEFENDQLIDLKISVNVQTKTYTEITALSNYIAQLVVELDTNVPVKVEIKSMNTTLAIIVRGANSNSVELIEM